MPGLQFVDDRAGSGPALDLWMCESCCSELSPENSLQTCNSVRGPLSVAEMKPEPLLAVVASPSWLKLPVKSVRLSGLSGRSKSWMDAPFCVLESV